MYSYIVWRSVAGSLTFMGLCFVLLVAFASSFLTLNNTQMNMTRVYNAAIWPYDPETTPYESYT